MLLSFIGAIVGVGLAALGIRMLDKLPITGIVRMEEVNLSGSVLAFTAGLTRVDRFVVRLHAGVARVRDGTSQPECAKARVARFLTVV